MKQNYITRHKPTVWPSFFRYLHVHSSVIDLFAVNLLPRKFDSFKQFLEQKKCAEARGRGWLTWQISKNCNRFHSVGDSAFLFHKIHSENKSPFFLMIKEAFFLWIYCNQIIEIAELRALQRANRKFSIIS